MNRINELLTQDLWALKLSLGLLAFFMTAFFLTAGRKRGKRSALVAEPDNWDTEAGTATLPGIEAADDSATETGSTVYTTVTNWISLRHAGALSHSGYNGSRTLSGSNVPDEIKQLMREIGLDIVVQDIRVQPERHVQLEISVNQQGYFEVGKRKGPSPFEYTLPRVTHSQVTFNVWQPFINFNKEQVYSQVRFGRLEDSSEWRIVFEIQHITDNFTHIDYELFWERVVSDRPAAVRLGGDIRALQRPAPGVYFRKS